ncbi:MAG: hypothetical protein AUI16_03525 [Alphaproteobacteria bacterium 13_2_20CM_2_64_7]|nr:MAG: hypothetical protein AUI16_03525 [Alphaproteobacteria bacterium 13_2_20CM_2_64_7]
MKTSALMFGTCILVTLPMTTAEAGQCTAEIESVTKLLASRDAGSGPTAGGAASTTVGQHPHTHPREQHPPTAAMNEATQGGAASTQDVQSQIRGGPTAAQQAEGARRPASENMAAAQAALNEARGFDQSGNESACMDAIQRAKRLGG